MQPLSRGQSTCETRAECLPTEVAHHVSRPGNGHRRGDTNRQYPGCLQAVCFPRRFKEVNNELDDLENQAVA